MAKDTRRLERCVDQHFDIRSLPGSPNRKVALLINPPVYDTQYWAEWSQPYGLLRVAALLRKHNYRKLWLYDFMEANEERKVQSYRINPDETYEERNRPDGQIRPIAIEKNGERL